MDHYTHEHLLDAPAPTTECFLYLLGGGALLSGDSRQMCLEFCKQNRELVISCLPGSLSGIAGDTDFVVILDLICRYGGRRLYLPTRIQRFCEQTGLQVSAHTYAQWRDLADVNGQIDIPSVWGLFLALRRAAIRLALTHDWTPEALHTTFGVSRRQLRAFRPPADPAGPSASRL
ncbi:hypothetical protein [Pseudomonas sp. microsymbiont 2]